MKREDLTFALFERKTGRFLGATGLHRPNWEARIFEIGYFQRTSAVGHGFMTEALISAIAQAAPEAKARVRAFLEGKAAKVQKG